MKREKAVGVMVTLEEWEDLRKKMRQAEDEEGKSYSASSYIRSKLLLPHLNGNQAPSVPDSKPENVSPSAGHTDTEQEDNPWDGDFLDGLEN